MSRTTRTTSGHKPNGCHSPPQPMHQSLFDQAHAGLPGFCTTRASGAMCTRHLANNRESRRSSTSSTGKAHDNTSSTPPTKQDQRGTELVHFKPWGELGVEKGLEVEQELTPKPRPGQTAQDLQTEEAVEDCMQEERAARGPQPSRSQRTQQTWSETGDLELSKGQELVAHETRTALAHDSLTLSQQYSQASSLIQQPSPKVAQEDKDRPTASPKTIQGAADYHPLAFLKLTIKGKPVIALLGTGCTHVLISSDLADELQLKRQTLKRSTKMLLGNGEEMEMKEMTKDLKCKAEREQAEGNLNLYIWNRVRQGNKEDIATELNKLTISCEQPIPNKTTIMEQLQEAKYFTIMDMESGFHQVRVAPEDQHKTAFRCYLGHFDFKVMPFGLQGAPETFQEIMTQSLWEHIGIRCAVYHDDVLVYSPTLEKHIEDVAKVLRALRDHKMFPKISKCKFAQTELAYLGTQ
ncbi:hypothetical protein Emag_007849 [Eimeria magna]